MMDRKRKNRFSDAATGERPAKASTQNPAALAKEAAAKIAQALPNAATSTSMTEMELIALEQRQRADLIFKSVQQQMTHIQSLIRKTKESNVISPFLPAPLLLNEKGQEIDQHGNVVVDSSPASVATLRVNQVTSKKVTENPYLSHRVVEKDDKLELADPRLKLKKRETRATKSLNFVQQGTIVKQAENLRAREAKKVLDGFASGRNPRGYMQESIAMVDEDTSGKSEMTPHTFKSMDTYDVPIRVVSPIPDVEWWDMDYLPKDIKPLFDKMGLLKSMARKENPGIQVKYTEMKLKYCGTAHVIEHPARILGSRPEGNVVLPLMLTAVERKKIRRNNRAEREKEKQDKIALGLMPPPEPKVKFSNMMKVLGEQAVADPSAVERKVRQQIAQREKNHEMRNLARKLTPEERRAKKLKKIKADANGDIHVAVFRLPDLSNPQHRFKVDVNAHQYHLTGGVLICRDENINVIVVEGGRKAIKHYVHLLTSRINWGQVDDETEKAEDLKPNVYADKCVLAWQGVVARRSFNNFRFQECRTSITARKVMEAKGVAHYWDLAEKSNQF